MVNKNFDDFIASTAPAVPSSDTCRRTTKTILGEKMRQEARRSRSRHRWGITLASVWIMASVLIIQAPNLGSDTFNFRVVEKDLANGESLSLVTGDIHGVVANTLPWMTTNDIQEMQQQIAASEGTAGPLKGYQFGSDAPYWLVSYLRTVNGKTFTSTDRPFQISVSSAGLKPEQVPFFVEHGQELIDLVDSGRLTAHPYGKVVADGRIYEVKMWTNYFSDWGHVTFYRGDPAD